MLLHKPGEEMNIMNDMMPQVCVCVCVCVCVGGGVRDTSALKAVCTDATNKL